MLQALDPIFPDAGAALGALEALICERIIEPLSPGRQGVERGYANELAYLSLILGKQVVGEDRMVQIEFGVHSDDARRAVGSLIVEWNSERHCFGPLELILLRGQQVDLPLFLSALEDYVDLPLAATELSE